MQFGLGLPHTGAAAHGPGLIRFAQRAEALGRFKRRLLV
jgi:hypothetical protein